MTEPAPGATIFIPESGELPDAFTDVVNALPRDLGLRPRIAPWSGTVDQGVTAVESLLDREELRRVNFIGVGRGADVALQIAAAQPRRVARMVLGSLVPDLDERQLKGVGTALKFIPGLFFRRGAKREVLDQVADLGRERNVELAGISVPTLIITGSGEPGSRVTQLLAELPDVRRSTIEGAGRLTHPSHAPAYGAAIGEFLRG